MKRSVDEPDWEAMAAARATRELAVRDHEPLVTAVQQILFDEDPIGINFGTNTDEYRLEAQLIVVALIDRVPRDPESSLTLVHEAFVLAFGSDIAGSADRYRESAEKVLERWHH